MFLNHAQSFASFKPAQTAACATLLTGTLVETPQGWRAIETLAIGDSVATLDGGFAPITHLQSGLSDAPLWRLPAGALNNCSDLLLSGDQYIATPETAELDLYDAPYVLLPVSALTGFRGIAPTISTAPYRIFELGFATEEVLYVQSGAMVHAPSRDSDDAFFQRLGYGETRAALALINRTFCAPDLVAA